MKDIKEDIIAAALQYLFTIMSVALIDCPS